MNSPNKNWQKIVSNARACLVSGRVYRYIDPEKKTGIIFNIFAFGYGHGLMNEWYAASEVVDGGRKGWRILFFVLKFRQSRKGWF